MSVADEARHALVAAVLDYVCHNYRAAAHGVARTGDEKIAALRRQADELRRARIGQQVAEEQSAAWRFESGHAEEARARREQERDESLAAAQASVAGFTAELADSMRYWNEVGEGADCVREQYADVRKKALLGYQRGDLIYDAVRQARDEVDAAAANLLRAKDDRS